MLHKERKEKAIKANVENQYVSLQVEKVKNALVLMGKEVVRLRNAIEQLHRKTTARSVFIKNLRDEGYKLREPLAISLEFENGGVCACCYDIDMYGEGKTEEEAIDDLCEVIIDYYESLKEDEDKLGEIPKRHWIYLKDVIES